MKNKLPVLVLSALVLLLIGCKKDKAVADPPPSPIAHYTFTNDYLNNSVSPLLEASYIGNISSTTDSFKTNYAAIALPGDGCITVADSDLLDFVGGEFTLAAWINPSKVNAAFVFHKSDGGGGPYALDIQTGIPHAFVRTTTQEKFEVLGTSTIIKNAWQHVAVTFNGKELSIYYNGKGEGTTMVDRPLATSTGNLSIGGYIYAFPAGCMTGKIDNVRIYDKALTSGQISSLAKIYDK